MCNLISLKGIQLNARDSAHCTASEALCFLTSPSWTPSCMRFILEDTCNVLDVIEDIRAYSLTSAVCPAFPYSPLRRETGFSNVKELKKKKGKIKSGTAESRYMRRVVLDRHDFALRLRGNVDLCVYGYVATFTCCLPQGHFASSLRRSSRESFKKRKKEALTATSSVCLEGGPTHRRAVYNSRSAGLIQQFDKISFESKCFYIFFPFFFFYPLNIVHSFFSLPSPYF